MVQGYAHQWPDEAVVWVKAQSREASIAEIRDGLRQFMNPVPSWSSTCMWLRQHAPRTRGGKGLYANEWANDAVRDWLEPRWHAGMSAPQMADGIMPLIDVCPSASSVLKFCRKTFGPRTGAAAVVVAQPEVETRTRRCVRCRQTFVLPRYVFRCESCRGSSANLGAPEGYRTMGLRVA